MNLFVITAWLKALLYYTWLLYYPDIKLHGYYTSQILYLYFFVELKKNSYCWLVLPRKIFLRSSTVSLLFKRKSLRNIIQLLELVIASIFFSCLGQLVETLSELQFWAEKVRLASTEARETAAAAAPLLAAWLGERRVHSLGVGLLHGVGVACVVGGQGRGGRFV